MRFFEFRAKHHHFLAKQTEFGRIFSSTTHITRIFSKKHTKDKPMYQYTHTSAAKFRNECLFCFFELILLVCIDVLPRCQQFCSHDATFPCPPRLNQYLAEKNTTPKKITDKSTLYAIRSSLLCASGLYIFIHVAATTVLTWTSLPGLS